MVNSSQLARALEPFNLYWLEVESFDPDALLTAREQTTTRLCHGESLIRREAFRPFFQKHVTDVVMRLFCGLGSLSSKVLGLKAHTRAVMLRLPSEYHFGSSMKLSAESTSARSAVNPVEIGPLTG